eukprot:CAMPEP_0194756842 /NCGR_PEP_ID=MMETSP0323_2-20130528/10473_1 /TAXON_ID=2866 ORGANISM="Crypthecodinium cohnii, Strain Seligo" /NCGR_SAMPLE_ID=MMETSP0323_2 /ASSEMBLY_ACC=CAM_ASM_000346 /LENGTH=55 /DNA_ID=CAMNT_0039676539 /DNA_START=228 /DNA_END=395 /DNA_ORIENTATION=-
MRTAIVQTYGKSFGDSFQGALRVPDASPLQEFRGLELVRAWVRSLKSEDELRARA